MKRSLLLGILFLVTMGLHISLTKADEQATVIQKVIEVIEVTEQGGTECDWVRYYYDGPGQGAVYAAKPGQGGPLVPFDEATKTQLIYFNRFCQENNYPVRLELDLLKGILFIVKGTSIESVRCKLR